MNIRHHSKKIVVTAAVVAIVGILGWIVLTPHQTAAPSTPPPSEQVSRSTQPPDVMVSLPRATPIVALKEDYASDTSLWRVVSKDYPLNNPHYTPTVSLATVATRSDKPREERSLRTDILPAVEALFAAAKNQGYDLMIGSGYRSYEQQAIYYNSYVAKNGQEVADTFSARPGRSEHQTGLTFDISYVDRTCYLDTCFGDTAAGKWLATHAAEYGFILRYPKDKISVTKYTYEPWHFRYVGKDLARALSQSELALDEAKPYLDAALSELKQRGQVK